MISKKGKTNTKKAKSVKANADIGIPLVQVSDMAAPAGGLVEAPYDIDWEYVRTEVKTLIEYLSQFDTECAKETVGNLAYVYVDLTECDK